MTSPTTGAMPRLVVAHGTRSAPALQIAEAATELCELIWLIDESLGDNALTARLLRKLGKVVDTAGLSPGEIAGRLREHQPTGLITFRDEDVVTLAALAAELGLDYQTSEVALSLVDKLLQRQAFERAGLPTPRFWEVPPGRDRAQLEELAAVVEYPAVLKPRSGSGGRYTVPLADTAALVSSVLALPPEAGADRGMFVEQYLAGGPVSAPFADYVSVESLVCRGRISHLALTGRFPLAEPFRETGFFIPALLPDSHRDAVLEAASVALSALGVRTGAFHTEIKLTPDGPRLLEVNGRLGGLVPEILSQASGEPVIRDAMRVALGETVVFDDLVECARVGWAFLVQPPYGAKRFLKIEDVDRLAQVPGLSRVHLNQEPGAPLDMQDGTRHYIYSVFGASADHQGLLEVDRYLHEEVVILYE